MEIRNERIQNTRKVFKCLPLMQHELTEDLRLKAQKELNETEENKRKGLKELRLFIEKENLPKELTDYELLMFLRTSKFNLEKTQERLLTNVGYRRRKEFVDYFEPEKLLPVFDRNIIGLLPNRDTQGRAIYYFRVGLWDPSICDFKCLLGSFAVLIPFAMIFEPTAISGSVVISDVAIQSATHQLMHTSALFKYIPYLRDFPLRIKRVDILNASAIFRTMHAVLRAFYPRKARERIHLHKGIEGLPEDLFPPSILPNEFGGTMGPISNAFCREEFIQFIYKMKAEAALY